MQASLLLSVCFCPNLLRQCNAIEHFVVVSCIAVVLGFCSFRFPLGSSPHNVYIYFLTYSSKFNSTAFDHYMQLSLVRSSTIPWQ